MATVPWPKSAGAEDLGWATSRRCHSSQCHCIARSACGESRSDFLPSAESSSPPKRRVAATARWKLLHMVP